MQQVFLNQEEHPYALEIGGRLDPAPSQLVSSSAGQTPDHAELQRALRQLISDNSLWYLQEAWPGEFANVPDQTTFVDMQQEVLDDNTAGAKANPLEVSGVPVAGSLLVDCNVGYVKAPVVLSDTICLMEDLPLANLCLGSSSQRPNTTVAAS